MNQQQPIVIKQGIGIWGALGWLLFFGLLYFVWQTVSTVNDVAQVFDTAVQTLEPSNDQPGAIILATSTPFSLPTTAQTATVVPAQTFGDYGLPGMGPYTLGQVNQCRDIITSGNLHTLQSPQRELCVQYVGN